MWRCQCRPLKIDGTPAGRPLEMDEACPLCDGPPPELPAHRAPVVAGDLVDLPTGLRANDSPKRRFYRAEDFAAHKERFLAADFKGRHALAAEIGCSPQTLYGWAQGLGWGGVQAKSPRGSGLARERERHTRYASIRPDYERATTFEEREAIAQRIGSNANACTAYGRIHGWDLPKAHRARRSA